MRSLSVSNGWAACAKRAPLRSQAGRPATNRSSSTQSRKRSPTTGQASSTPSAARTRARASSVVGGTRRSTVEQGKLQPPAIQSASAGALRAAKAGDDEAQGAAGPVERGQVVLHLGVLPLQRAAGRVVAVAFLGDGQAQDAGVRVGDQRDHRRRVFGCDQALAQAAYDL